MRTIWGLLLIALISHVGAIADTSTPDHELLLAGAGDSLEVTLISHIPLPVGAADVRQWLTLPDAAGCQLLRAPRAAPVNDADRPQRQYVWQFQCTHLQALTQLDFDSSAATGKLYLQWVLPASQGKALVDEPLASFSFAAANQAGGT